MQVLMRELYELETSGAAPEPVNDFRALAAAGKRRRCRNQKRVIIAAACEA